MMPVVSGILVVIGLLIASPDLILYLPQTFGPEAG
jgi:urea transporter